MSAINIVYNVDRWKILLKLDNEFDEDDIIYEVIIGSCSDENEYYNLVEYISKENYDNIMNRTYTFKAFPHSNQKVIIFDQNNNIVPLVKGKKDDEYSNTQMEYIKQLVKK